MFSNFKKILIVLVTTAFVSNSFAWTHHRHATRCVGDHCKHVSTTKHCNNGHCSGTHHKRAWHR
jgi:hypothetical protein